MHGRASSLFFEQSPDYLAVIDRAFKFVAVNPAWAGKFCSNLDHDPRGQEILALVDSANLKKVKLQLSSLLETGGSLDINMVCPCRGGAFEEFRWHVVATKSASMLLITATKNELATVEDLQRVQAEKEFEILFQSMREGVVVQGSTGKVERFNAAALRILGVSEGQLLGTTAQDPSWRAMDSEGRAIAKDSHPGNLCRRTGKPVIDQLMAVKSPGRDLCWMKVTAIPISIDSQGMPVRVLITFADITDAKSAELKFKQIFENIPAGMTMLDQDLRFVETNPAFQKWIGYNGSELRQMRISDVTYFEDVNSTIRFTETLERIGVLSNKVEKRYVSKDGQILWGRVSACRLQFGHESGDFRLFASIEDITAEKIAEEAHERTSRQADSQRLLLIQSAKMSELGEMAGGIAHEINNPLAIIAGKAVQVTRLVRDGAIDKDGLLTALQLINRTADRIAKIVRGLRAYSRNSEHDPLSCNEVQTIIDDTVELCREKIKASGVNLEINCPPGIMIDCRPAQISQVIMNLIGNSLDAVSSTPDAWIRLSVENASGKVVVAVVDSGRGIPAETASRMMKPFFTTKDMGKGTGLGLSISASILSQHHGVLTYDSTSPHTRFVLILPISAKSADLEQAA